MSALLFVILNYHEHNYVKNLIQEIDSQVTKVDKYVYIGDIQPTIQEEEKMMAIIKDMSSKCNSVLKYIKFKENLGYAKGNNRIIKTAIKEIRESVEYVVISNPDIKIQEQLLIQNLIDKMNEFKDCSLIGPKVKTENGRQQGPYLRQTPLVYGAKHMVPFIWYPFWKFRENKIERIKSVKKVWRLIGAFMIIKYKDFDNIGMFDENTFLYWEEDILSYKLSKINKAVYFEPNEQVIHMHKGKDTRKINQFNIDSMNYYFEMCGYSEKVIKFANVSIKLYNFLSETISKYNRRQ